eukprot:jgi/Orpsp1_1/1177994/evm.model.c7180000063659.1
MTNEFSKYAKENNLDLELSYKLYSPSNSSNIMKDYETTIDYLLSKGSTKYDIFYYNAAYTNNLSAYLINLEEWLPKEHIERYTNGVATKTCTANGKWVGL